MSDQSLVTVSLNSVGKCRINPQFSLNSVGKMSASNALYNVNSIEETSAFLHSAYREKCHCIVVSNGQYCIAAVRTWFINNNIPYTVNN